MSPLRTALRSQRGVAMPVVMGTLLVLSLLSAAMFSTALRSSADAGADTNAKRALAAAEAGLQTAVYRLKRINPGASMCMTTAAVAPIAGECPASAPEAVGAGATFSYHVTPTGATCGALPGYVPTASDRCITSTGVVNGVKRRIQARVSIDPSLPFAISGVVGINWIRLENEVTLDETDVGSNGPINVIGSPVKVEIKAATVRPYPPGTVIRSGTTTVDSIVNSTQPYGLGQPDWDATLPPSGTNNNAALNPSYYNSTTRALNIPADTTYKLPAGKYNLCSWNMVNGSEVEMVNASDKAQIYIDSPRRSGSGCPAGSGKLRAVGDNIDEMKVNTGRDDANVSIYVYGTTSDASAEDVYIANKAHFDAVYFAPDSIFHATTNINMHGGVVAGGVIMDKKVDAKLDAALKATVGPGAGLARRKAWLECKPLPTVATDPESGC